MLAHLEPGRGAKLCILTDPRSTKDIAAIRRYQSALRYLSGTLLTSPPTREPMGKLLPPAGLISACLLTGCGGGGAIGGGGNGGGGGSQPPVLASLQISPTNPSVAAGLKQKFTATGKFSDGSTRDMTASVTWASSSPSVATINVSGTPGLAKGVAPGSTTISATSGGVSGTTTLAVGNALLTSIAVTPGNATIPLGVQQQFTAIGMFTDGTSSQLTSNVLWSSSNNTVLSISASGLGVSGAVGAVTVTATSAGMNGSWECSCIWRRTRLGLPCLTSPIPAMRFL